MLIDGFDQLSTMSTIYHYPYYPRLIEQLGFEKEIDWVERKVMVPTADEHQADMQKYFRVAEMSMKRYNLHMRHFKSAKEILAEDGGKYVQKCFNIINKAYAGLYGYSEMNERQINQYATTYLQFLDMRLLAIVENEENEPVAMGVGMGSLSYALQKAHGKLFPFGWWHLAKAIFFKPAPVIDLLLWVYCPSTRTRVSTLPSSHRLSRWRRRWASCGLRHTRSWRTTRRARDSGHILTAASTRGEGAIIRTCKGLEVESELLEQREQSSLLELPSRDKSQQS
jgi:hypothetical protein